MVSDVHVGFIVWLVRYILIVLCDLIVTYPLYFEITFLYVHLR